MDVPVMDHDVLVKKKPKFTARLLDRYRKMVGSLYNTHQVMVEDKTEMLEDLTDTTRRQKRAQMTRQESEGSHFSPVVGTHSYPT
jgi:phage regulator Rha-like protein